MNLEKNNTFGALAGADKISSNKPETEKLDQEALIQSALDKENFFIDKLAKEQSGQETISPEKREKLKLAATNIIDCFNFEPTKESFLVITDDKVMRENGELIEAIKADLEKRTTDKRAKGSYKMIVAPAAPNSAASFGPLIGRDMMKCPMLIITSMSRSHSKETGRAIRGEDYHWGNLSEEYQDKLRQFALRNGSRLISVTKGHNPFEILTQGAVEEPVEILRERAEKVDNLFKDVQTVKITSKLGSDLVLSPRFDKKEIEDGNISTPGKLSNYPIGEWSCSPRQEGANGVLVVDGPIGGNHNLDMIKEYGPLKLEIKNGDLISINDLDIKNLISSLDKNENIPNPLIASVVKYLHSGGNDQASFRLAEFAVGTNSKACAGKPDAWHGSSEGEKKYGTIHIAFGSNGTFGVEKNDPNFNDCHIHCDFVVGYQEPIEVECFKKDQSNFKLINEQGPQGY